jgi:hypothetical protein
MTKRTWSENSDNALMGWSEDVVRRAELHPELHPLPIFAGDPPEPINATSAAIVRRRDERGDSFALELYDPAGSLLEFLQFETLEITLDQAAAIIGVHPADWRAGSGA